MSSATLLEADFDGRCAACGAPIIPGDPIVPARGGTEDGERYLHDDPECIDEWEGSA